jgi:hypothetical protein
MIRRVVLALLAVAVLAPAAHGATGTGTTQGLPGGFTPKTGAATLNEKRVTAIFLRNDKVADWLDRYREGPRHGRDLRQGPARLGSRRLVELGRRDRDRARRRRDGRGHRGLDGPQVAWKMARGTKGAFGGRQINSLPIWLGLCGSS